jgi:hypothetical protein
MMSFENLSLLIDQTHHSRRLNIHLSSSHQQQESSSLGVVVYSVGGPGLLSGGESDDERELDLNQTPA